MRMATEAPRWCALLCAVWLAGCAAAPPAPIEGPQPGQAALGIEVEVRPPLSRGKRWVVTQVYFAPVDAQGEPDLTALHVSQQARNGRVFLLNVPPGRYVAVAGVFRALTSRYVTYFPYDAVVESRTAATAGRLSFAGRYVFDTVYGVCWERGDALQLHIAEAVLPGEPKCSMLALALHHALRGEGLNLADALDPTRAFTLHFGGVLAEVHRDGDARRAFAEGAQADLQDTGWVVDTE